MKAFGEMRIQLRAFLKLSALMKMSDQLHGPDTHWPWCWVCYGVTLGRAGEGKIFWPCRKLTWLSVLHASNSNYNLGHWYNRVLDIYAEKLYCKQRFTEIAMSAAKFWGPRRICVTPQALWGRIAQLFFTWGPDGPISK